MSNELSAQDLLPPEIGLTLLGFEKSEQGWLVRAEGRTRSECPSCGTQSTARHSRYWRQLQDLPVQGKRVVLRLRLSRWRCRNRECEQAIFRERLGEVVATWARRTSRVEEVLLLVAPHDLRRTAAKLCRSKGGELEQIKFLLGHESILTTERYLGSEQDLKNAVNDALVFE